MDSNHNKTRKTFLIVFIIIVCTIVVAGSLSLIYKFVYIPEVYENAISAEKEKNYSEASELFAKIPKYKDSWQHLYYNRALTAYQLGDYMEFFSVGYIVKDFQDYNLYWDSIVYRPLKMTNSYGPNEWEIRLKYYDDGRLIEMREYNESWSDCYYYTYNSSGELIEKRDVSGFTGEDPVELVYHYTYDYNPDGTIKCRNSENTIVTYTYEDGKLIGEKEVITEGYSKDRWTEKHFTYNEDNLVETEEIIGDGHYHLSYQYLYDSHGTPVKRINMDNPSDFNKFTVHEYKVIKVLPVDSAD